MRNCAAICCSLRSARSSSGFAALDRAFTVKGAGLVVTGTALSGEVRVGDTLWLTGVNTPMRVRGLHAQNQAVEQAHAGQRIALNIVGDAQKRQCTAATGCSPHHRRSQQNG